jgi:PEP-CTERM motif
MNFKSSVLGLALVAALAPAMAADQSIDLSSGYAAFGSTSPLLSGGDDLITFTNLASGTYDFAVSITSQYIGNLSASLNGQALDVSGAGKFRFAYLEGQSLSPLLLEVAGTTITSPLASYSVTMSATPVPEPETYALMLAGLGVVGFLARRRRAD